MQPLGVPALMDAVRTLHHPGVQSDETALIDGTHPAWVRIKFEELLAQQMSLKRAHDERRSRAAPAMPRRKRAMTALVARLLKALPFSLTAAQERVGGEIALDLTQPHPMQRLLQGDVGSGKTIVAALAAAQAIDAGYQAALMAPTEILAEQHARKLRGWLEPLGVSVAWLAGSLKTKEKRAAIEAAALGTAQLVIGTHAIIQDAVEFARLGLVIVDEQHRFGVAQRLALRAKARNAADGAHDFQPHQLMMSATPIPRTLAMTYYADLDVSTIDELPPGRTPILTKLGLRRAARRGDRPRARGCVDGTAGVLGVSADRGKRDLAVADGGGDVRDAGSRVARTERWTGARTSRAGREGGGDGCVHAQRGAVAGRDHGDRSGGRCAERIVNGDRTRGAVRFGAIAPVTGTGGARSAASVCVLLYTGPLSMTARARLQTMRETTDGFEIARRDLEIRGPGNFSARGSRARPCCALPTSKMISG